MEDEDLIEDINLDEDIQTIIDLKEELETCSDKGQREKIQFKIDVLREKVSTLSDDVDDEDDDDDDDDDDDKITSDAEFTEYAETILKKSFGDKYDADKAKKTIAGILKKADGDYGAAIGMLTSSSKNESSFDDLDDAKLRVSNQEIYINKLKKSNNDDPSAIKNGVAKLDALKAKYDKLKTKVKAKNESSFYSDQFNNLTESDETLSEEFKEKAGIIFEASLSERVREEKERLAEQFIIDLNEEKLAITTNLIEKVDNYLTYAVESWVEDNKIAVESGLRTEVAERFISSLKDVFVEHYIEVPDTKRDIVSELEQEVSTVKEALCESAENEKRLNEQVEKLTRDRVLVEASESLADTQRARLYSLAEDIKFNDEDSFIAKVKTIKECYFATKNDKQRQNEGVRKNPSKTIEVITEDINPEDEEKLASKEMKLYLDTLGRINKSNHLSGSR